MAKMRISAVFRKAVLSGCGHHLEKLPQSLFSVVTYERQ